MVFVPLNRLVATNTYVEIPLLSGLPEELYMSAVKQIIASRDKHLCSGLFLWHLQLLFLLRFHAHFAAKIRQIPEWTKDLLIKNLVFCSLIRTFAAQLY